VNKEKKLGEPAARLFQRYDRHRPERKLILCLFCDRQEERGVPSHGQRHNRWQLDAAIPGSPKHGVAPWATPLEECHVLVSLDLAVVLFQREEGYFHRHEIE